VIVIHDVSLAAVQLHPPDTDVTVTPPVVALASTVALEGEIVKLQLVPAAVVPDPVRFPNAALGDEEGVGAVGDEEGVGAVGDVEAASLQPQETVRRQIVAARARCQPPIWTWSVRRTAAAPPPYLHYALG